MDMMDMFRQTYLEESFEGIAVMESGLLNLSLGKPDSEQINTIFRAAHSIKGGSGTFGFSELSGFTHVLETLLDEIRSNKRDVTQDAVEAMLASVDVLRDMLTKLQHHEPIDQQRASLAQARLERILGIASDVSLTRVEQDTTSSDSQIDASVKQGWLITLKPERDLLKTGNEPIRIFRELEGLGEVHVIAHQDQLPDWQDYDAESLYLWWELTLYSDTVSLAQVKEVFEWIDGEGAEILVEPLLQAAVVNDVSIAVPAVASSHHDVESSHHTIISAQEIKKQSIAPPVVVAAQQESSIRVSIGKVDHLIDLVGELVITQSMLSQFSEQEPTTEEQKEHWLDRLRDGVAQLERYTRQLQESVMSIRMMPISFAFNRMPRIVHDTSLKLNKKIELVMIGEHTEVDKTVLEQLTDPLVHIVRNSIDHGIEMPAVRLANGKPESGTVTMAAFHQGGNIIIKITDDGAGINLERVKQKAIEKGIIEASGSYADADIVDLIFHPGFSTADQVSDISGRGVGMDVVRRNIRSLGGRIEVETKQGVGSVFSIHLPLTLAIMDGQLSRVGSQTYVFPLISIVESIQPTSEQIKTVTGTELFRLRDNYIPILRLYKQFSVQDSLQRLEDGLLVVVESLGKQVAVFVDDLQGQQQVVIKSLDTNYIKVRGGAGATILGDGMVALIIDIAELVATVDDTKHLSMAE
jgi:two-component system chemotaxis sensor kinase CheA